MEKASKNITQGIETQTITLEAMSQFDTEGVLSLIGLVGQSFRPTIHDRVGVAGYLQYLKGNNQEYIHAKYGENVAMPKGASTIVAKTDSMIVGLCSYFRKFEYYNGSYLVCVMVHPQYTGNGIGGNLVDRILSVASREHVSNMTVTTWSTNVASKHLFLSRGFRIQRIEKDERGNGIDGVYLHKLLSDVSS